MALDSDDMAGKLLDLAIHHIEGEPLEDDVTFVVTEIDDDWQIAQIENAS